MRVDIFGSKNQGYRLKKQRQKVDMNKKSAEYNQLTSGEFLSNN